MRLAMLLLLTGCSENLAGHWDGVCDFQDAMYAYDADIGLDIDDGRGHQLDGSVAITMWDGLALSGDFTGDRNDSYVELHSELFQDGDTYELSIITDLVGVDLEGTCALSVPRGGGALTGEIVLER